MSLEDALQVRAPYKKAGCEGSAERMELVFHGMRMMDEHVFGIEDI